MNKVLLLDVCNVVRSKIISFSSEEELNNTVAPIEEYAEKVGYDKAFVLDESMIAYLNKTYSNNIPHVTEILRNVT